MSDTLLEIRDLKKHFPVMKGIILQKPVGLVKAVDGVSYSINPGETGSWGRRRPSSPFLASRPDFPAEWGRDSDHE